MAEKYLITYRFRVKDKDARRLRRCARACDIVWNYCCDAQKHAVKWRIRRPTYFDLINKTAGVSKELGIHSDTIASLCKRFVDSCKKHKKVPRYRTEKSLRWVPFVGRNITLVDSGVVYKKHIFRYFKSRELKGDIVCGNFASDSCGRWFINLVCAMDAPSTKMLNPDVGIDLGLKSFAVLSNGRKIENPRVLHRYAKKLASAQRARNKKRVRAIYRKIANVRKHFLHTESTKLVKEFGGIFVGNVSSKSLSKTKMAKSVFDAGWGSFKRMLSYKAVAHGGRYFEVCERGSTQTCSCCGAITGPKGVAGLRIREWECSACGAHHERDVNAAINIFAFAAEHRRPVAESRAA